MSATSSTLSPLSNSHLAPLSMPLGPSPQWFTICNHEWSFLEGEKRHSHTLKAGFHQFPFQLQLGGALPSSIATSVHGAGAHVSYKFRAVAVRPGLAQNIQAVMPISIVRTFPAEALEYQQSLEIENTWPDKLMYSIMIPHKAWAVGDNLTAILKFSPLSKGVRVLTVATTIGETTKFHYKGGAHEHTRGVVTANHDILNGNAIPAVERHASIRGSPWMSMSLPPTPGLSSEDRAQSFGSLAAIANQDLALRQVSSRVSSSSSSSSSPSSSPSSSSSSSSSSHDFHLVPAPPLPSSESLSSSAEPVASTSTSTAEEEVPPSQDDIVTQLTLFIPKSVTPSHSLEPITVSHRIRWSILMSNLDGHTSELRCSLPLHILDARLLSEARVNSAATRRLLLGGPEVPVDEEQDAELPSYSAHVRDRVANMYLPDSATTRVLNPWIHSNVSPTFMSEHQILPGAWTPSGIASPLMPNPVSSHLPDAPQSGTSTPLDWVNSELLLSLSNIAPPRLHTSTSPQPHSPSDPVSRPESRLVSRHGSRAPSPERHLTMTTITSIPVPSTTAAHETFVHDGHASRTLPGLFSIQMKPYTSLTSTGWLSSRSNSFSNLALLADMSHAHRASMQSHNLSRQSTLPMSVPVSMSHTSTPTPGTMESVPESMLWHRAFTEVPGYGVASRGFIGGVTPLTSMRGLPSYEEAERSAHGGNGLSGDDERLTIRRAAPGRDRVA